jgi:hypothetical protein
VLDFTLTSVGAAEGLPAGGAGMPADIANGASAPKVFEAFHGLVDTFTTGPAADFPEQVARGRSAYAGEDVSDHRDADSDDELGTDEQTLTFFMPAAAPVPVMPPIVRAVLILQPGPLDDICDAYVPPAVAAFAITPPPADAGLGASAASTNGAEPGAAALADATPAVLRPTLTSGSFSVAAAVEAIGTESVAPPPVDLGNNPVEGALPIVSEESAVPVADSAAEIAARARAAAVLAALKSTAVAGGPAEPLATLLVRGPQPVDTRSSDAAPLLARPAFAAPATTVPHVPLQLVTSPAASAVPGSTAVDQTPAPETVDQIVQAIRLVWSRGVGEAQIRLQPDHLGEMSVSIRVEHGQVIARLQSDVPAVREWLQGNHAALRQGLADHNLSLDRFEVVASEDADRTPPRDQRDSRRDDDPRPRRPRRPSPDHVFDIVA